MKGKEHQSKKNNYSNFVNYLDFLQSMEEIHLLDIEQFGNDDEGNEILSKKQVDEILIKNGLRKPVS